jgi:predicted RNase H-like nuclease
VQIAAARARFLSSAERLGRGRVVGRDDIVDALACLVVAYRVASGQVQTFPDGSPQLDERGLRMEILA